MPKSAAVRTEASTTASRVQQPGRVAIGAKNAKRLWFVRASQECVAIFCESAIAPDEAQFLPHGSSARRSRKAKCRAAFRSAA